MIDRSRFDFGLWVKVYEKPESAYSKQFPDAVPKRVTLEDAKNYVRDLRTRGPHEKGLPRRGLILCPDFVHLEV